MHDGPRGTRTLRTMAFSVAATTTNKIEDYTTPGDVTGLRRVHLLRVVGIALIVVGLLVSWVPSAPCLVPTSVEARN